MSRRLNILCMVFKIIAFFIITLFSRLNVRVGILRTCARGKHLHFPKRGCLVHKTSLNPPCLLWNSVILYREGGGAPGVSPPPKIGKKIWFFGVKSWFFIPNTPIIFAPPSAIGKNMIFWRKIVIFPTKYPNNFFKCAPPNLKSWIRPCYIKL